MCLSTVAVLREVLTEENVGALVAKAAYLSRADTEHLVATLRPRTAPRDGVRKLPEPAVRRELELPVADPGDEAAPGQGERAATPPAAVQASKAQLPPGLLAPPEPPRPRRPELEPVSEDQWSLRVSIDAALREDLARLTALLSHKLPKGDLVSVLREAVACAIEKHGKRKGAVRPKRARSASGEPAGAAPGKAAAPGRAPGAAPGKAPAAPSPDAIPAEVRRQVWERDGGRCTFVGPDGCRCGSRYKVEPHHRVPAARGGPATLENLTLHCQAHNRLEAERDFGKAHVARFRRRSPEAPRTGEFTSSRRSDQG